MTFLYLLRWAGPAGAALWLLLAAAVVSLTGCTEAAFLMAADAQEKAARAHRVATLDLAQCRAELERCGCGGRP
jgi:hypothetical protein